MGKGSGKLSECQLVSLKEQTMTCPGQQNLRAMCTGPQGQAGIEVFLGPEL